MFNELNKPAKKNKYFWCQRCARQCYGKPVTITHQPSQSRIKICERCHRDLISEKNQGSLMFTAG